MKKVAMVFCIIGCMYVNDSNAFRVTKDYGHGIKTYQDSKKGVHSVSFDGGNEWVRIHETPHSASDVAAVNSKKYQNEIERAKAEYHKLQDAGEIVVVNGSVTDIAGKRINLTPKIGQGKMEVNWNEAEKFVFLKSLNGVKYSKETTGKIYKITTTPVSISQVTSEDMCGLPRRRTWKTVYKGYLMEAVEYVVRNKL